MNHKLLIVSNTEKTRIIFEIYKFKMSEKKADQILCEKFFLFLKSLQPVAKIAILSLILVLAFFTRVFSIIRYESVIHEFDPWFNY